MNIKKKRLIILAAGILLGLVGGFAYWKFVGCNSGTCPITSNWHSSTIIGGFMGYLIADSIKPKPRKTNTEEKQ